MKTTRLILVAITGLLAGVLVSNAFLAGGPDAGLADRIDVLERQVAARTSRVAPVRGQVDWAKVSRQALPSVVQIRALGSDSDSAGSGAIISDNGLIITANHVISDEGGRPADRVFIDYSDGSSARARLLGRSPSHDLALYRAPLPDSARAMPLALGAPLTGEPVAVLGAPFGRAESLSVGVISGTGRTLQGRGGFRINDAVQTDAPVNRGNSGGPLIDPAGRLLGVIAQLESDTNASSGVGFAISAATLSALLDRMVSSETHEPGYAGITALDVTDQLASELGLSVERGALVQAIAPGSAAAAAGLSSPSGTRTLYGEQIAIGAEVISAVDGQPIGTAADLAHQISLRAPGDEVDLRLERDGRSRTISLTLQERPAA